MKCIAYSGGYKYQLKRTLELAIGLVPAAPVHTEYVRLDLRGVIVVREGYAWDGPSGPAIDSVSFMRGSLVHDALYQLMRDGHLDHLHYRDAADRTLQKLCLEDGMWRIFAWCAYWLVRRWGDPYCDPARRRPPLRAPRGCGP